MNNNIHISVYAICKNESAFVERWLKNMWNEGTGADKVYVLDTGSEDNTIEEFHRVCKDLNVPDGWLILKQKKYEEFRFDVARNDNVEMIDEDNTDALFCVDLDELVISDFWDDLRNMVRAHPNFERIYYQYAWSHDLETKEPKWYFWYDKITKPKWRWKYPVHESLYCDNKKELGYSGIYYLDSRKIYLHHWPDDTKSRSSYLSLLELRDKEYPDDLYGKFYLMREYSFINDYFSAVKIGQFLYAKLKSFNKKKLDDMNMMPALCVSLGSFYLKISMKDEAEYFFVKAIEESPSYRDGYIRLAQLYAYQGKYEKVYKIIEDMDKNAVFTPDWRSIVYSWRLWKRNQILADAKCWEEKYDEAFELIKEACKDIKTMDDRRDAFNEGFYSDLQFICKKTNKTI